METFKHADEMVKWCSLFGKQAIPQKAKDTVTVQHCIIVLNIYIYA